MTLIPAPDRAATDAAGEQPERADRLAQGQSRQGDVRNERSRQHSVGTMLAPNRMELCYMRQSPDARVASCTEMTKQP